MIFIEINQNLKVNLAHEIFEKASLAAIKEGPARGEADLTVVITDNKTLRKLNKQFREIDGETDVLSFSSDETDPDSGNKYLGDVIISYPQALDQAVQAGHPVENELQLLTVHGVLHLIGFDHNDIDEKARMWEAQEAALIKLGMHGIKIMDDQE